MKSWRFTGTNEPLRLEELPEPSAGPGKVVIDVKAAGICHTDVGILTDPGWMTMLGQVPVTLGHEDAGVISAVGDGVTDFKVGDRVAICPTTSAGCPGSSFDGGFGPKIVIGTEALVRIPDEVDFVNGAAATDAGMTSYAAVVRRGGVKAGDKVGIIGLGGLGQIGARVAYLLGAEVYAGGTLNKPLLASYLFGSPEHAKEINCIVHPRVKEDFRRWTQCRTAFPIVGIESAILVEAGFAGEVDAIVMVYAPEEVRISRAVRRDASSRELIEKRIRSQMDDEEKRKYADFVIVNDGETPLIPQVLELIGSLSEKMYYL